MDIIKWGILGTGGIAAAFARGLGLIPDAKLAAVGSRAQGTADIFGRRFNIPQRYGRYEDLARDPDLDVVYVATPHSLHKENCRLLLEEGKAVLCEKPFTVNADEAAEVINLARQKELFCMEAMWMRFFPIVQQAKKWLDEGILGEVKTLTASLGFPVPYEKNSRFFTPELGGGSLLDLGVYPLSLAYFLFGEPARVYGRAVFAPYGVDEQTAMVLEYPDRTAVLTSSLRAEEKNEAVISGTRGRMTIHSPFISPQKVSCVSFASSEAGNPRKKKIKEVLKKIPLAHDLHLRFGSFLRRPAKSAVRIIAGNGLNYEAEEVTRYLKAGLTESPVMPLDETLKIMKTMDDLRAQFKRTAE